VVQLAQAETLGFAVADEKVGTPQHTGVQFLLFLRVATHRRDVQARVQPFGFQVRLPRWGGRHHDVAAADNGFRIIRLDNLDAEQRGHLGSVLLDLVGDDAIDHQPPKVAHLLQGHHLVTRLRARPDHPSGIDLFPSQVMGRQRACRTRAHVGQVAIVQ